jgi:hypothetical protein
LRALLVEHGAHDFENEGTAVGGDQLRRGIKLEQPVDRGQRATRGGGGIQHGG